VHHDAEIMLDITVRKNSTSVQEEKRTRKTIQVSGRDPVGSKETESGLGSGRGRRKFVATPSSDRLNMEKKDIRGEGGREARAKPVRSIRKKHVKSRKKLSWGGIWEGEATRK